jgi:AcrR family transcriptional regulator
MESILDTVKRRRYDASRRREQARLNRQAIITAAKRRFLHDGFTVTTVTSIAADAGASPDTIYKSFGGKAGLLRAMCEDALKGEGPIPAEQRSDAMQATEADPRRMLRGLGKLTTEVAPRIAPLLLLLSTAAETDTSLAGLRAEFESARLARMTHVAQTLARKTRLRPDLSIDEAAEIMWAYSSPELYRLLVLTRGWRTERYGEFIGDSLVDALLGPTSTTAPYPSTGSGRERDGGTDRQKGDQHEDQSDERVR